MPTTNDSRAIKINANGPHPPPPPPPPPNPQKISLGLVLVASVILAGYLLGCQFALLPGGICGKSALQANLAPTATPSATPRPLALATNLPACPAATPVQPYEIDCGSVLNETQSASCNADGTVTYVITYNLYGAAKDNIEQQINNNQKPDTNPPGVCQYTRLEPDGGQYEVDITCVIPSGSTLSIAKSFAGSTCQVSKVTCAIGYTLVDSLIGETGNLYCVPNVKMNQENLCPQGQFYNPEGCCSPVPVNSVVSTCGNLTKTANGYQCDYYETDKMILSFEAPTCAAPAPPRPTPIPTLIPPTPQPTDEPTSERTPAPACTPDATGGGCP